MIPELRVKNQLNKVFGVIFALLFVSIIFLSHTSPVRAETIEKHGIISANDTWTSGNIYLVTSSVSVINGITLTIEPGVIVKFNSGQSLTIDGILVSQGTESDPIIFTSYRDESFTGGSDAGVKGDWAGITLRSPGTASISNILIRYAINGLNVSADGSSENVSPTIENVIIEKNSVNGLTVYASGLNSIASPSIQNAQIFDCTSAGVYVHTGASSSNASPTVIDMVLGGNGRGVNVMALSGTTAIVTLDGGEIYNSTTFPVYLSNNGWLLISGSTHIHDNKYQAVGLSGTLYVDRTWSPITGLPFWMDSIITVNPGVTLTLPEGVIIKGDAGSKLTVDGSLISQGNDVNPVVFTSFQDDNYGGDSNGDGLSTPIKGSWTGLEFLSPETILIEYLKVFYASIGVRIYAYSENLTPIIRHNHIQFSLNEGIQVNSINGIASPQIIDNIITENGTGIKVFIGTGGITNPEIHENDIFDNLTYGVNNQNTSVTINADNNWWGHESGPYNATSNPTGKGDAVSDYVLFSPFKTSKIILQISLNLSPKIGIVPLDVTCSANIFGGTGPYTYEWDFGTGEISNDITPEIQYSVTGIYTIHLVINSNDGQTASIQESIDVRPPLSVSIEASPESGISPLVVTFHGIVNGGIEPYTYFWDMDEDGESESSIINPIYTVNLTTNVEFTVIDSQNTQLSTTKTILVDQPFDANIIASSTSGIYPLTISFSGQASGGVSPYTYYWDLDGDGNYETTGQTVEHTYTKPEVIRVLMRVRSNNGIYAYTSQIVTVKRPPLAMNFLQLDASKFPIVDAHVRVVDSNLQMISGLTSNNFSLTEQSESESSPINETLDVKEITEGENGIAIALVIDTSGSMGGPKLTDAKFAAHEFIDNLGNLDRVSIISFDDTATIVQTFTNDKLLLHTAVDSLIAAGGTLMYEGVYLGIDQCNTQIGSRAVVVFTDGETLVSIHTEQETIDHANETGTPVFTIGVGDAVEDPLIRLAEETGAFYTPAPSTSDLTQIYLDISTTLQNHYLLTYITHNPILDNTIRTVEVSVDYEGNSDTKSKQYQAIGNPVINLTSETIEILSNSQPQGVEIPITVEVQGEDISAVTLYYRSTIESGSYISIPMTLYDSGEQIGYYNGLIPSSEVIEPGMDFYLEATTGTWTSSSPQTNPSTGPYQIAIIPNYAPVINHTPITCLPTEDDLIVQAEVTDSTDYVESVSFHYRESGHVIYKVISMQNPSVGNIYEGTLSNGLIPQNGIEYYITATDNNNITTYQGTPDFPYLVDILCQGNYFTLSGNITDENGFGIQGVEIPITEYLSTFSDEMGNFSISLPSGLYTIKPSINSYFFKPYLYELNLDQNRFVFFYGFNCTSPSGINVCNLQPGDILLSRTKTTMDTMYPPIFALGGTYFTHAAMYIGMTPEVGGGIETTSPRIAEAQGYVDNHPEDEILETEFIYNSFWESDHIIDWAVVRPNLPTNIKEDAVNFIREKAIEEDVIFDLYADRIDLKKYYCSKLVWHSYLYSNGGDLETDVGFNSVVFDFWVTPDDLYYSTLKGSEIIQRKNTGTFGEFVSMIWSPAHIMLVDSNGNRAGYDPVSGLILNEIPTATYNAPPDAEVETIAAYGVENGWKIIVTGYDYGSYILNYHFLSSTSDDFLIEMTTSPGQIDEFTIEPISFEVYIPFISR